MPVKVWLPTLRAGTGADVYTERVAAGLERRGMQACVTWHNRYFELFPYLLGRVPLPLQTDIVLANSWYGHAFRRQQARLIIAAHHCVHDAACTPYKSVLQKIYHAAFIYRHEQRSFMKADRVVAISNYTADTVTRIFNVRRPDVIYNGIDTDFFSPGQMTAGKKKFNLLFVGTPSRRKGFDLLPLIMQKLGNRFTLLYTGKSGQVTRDSVENMQNAGWLDGNALVAAYRECDALLFPSRYEGFGYAVCEAMACGKPVITSDNSSLPELVQHNESGLLCRTDDIDAFVTAARLLADNPDLARHMGGAGREHVLRNFTLEKMTDNYIRLFEEVLSA